MSKISHCDGKRDRIRELKLCWKCLKCSHAVGFCNFKLSQQCRKCSSGKFHWEFLCTALSNEENTNIVSFSSDSNREIKVSVAPGKYKAMKLWVE